MISLCAHDMLYCITDESENVKRIIFNFLIAVTFLLPQGVTLYTPWGFLIRGVLGVDEGMQRQLFDQHQVKVK